MLKRSILMTIIILVIGLTIANAQDTTKIQLLEKEINQLSADFQAGKINAQQYQQRMLEIQNEMRAAATAQQTQRDQVLQTSPSFNTAQLQRLETLMNEEKRINAQLNEGRITRTVAEQRIIIVQEEVNQIVTPFANSRSASNQIYELEEKVRRLWPGLVLGWPADSIFLDRKLGILRQPAGTWASYSIRPADSRPHLDSFILYLNNASESDYQNFRRQIETIEKETFKDGLFYILREVEPNGTHWYYRHAIWFGNEGVIRYERSSFSYDDGPGTIRRD